MSQDGFRTTVPGKWVLSGEHTVLRGGNAIALPHPSFSLSLQHIPAPEPLRVVPESAGLAVQEVIRLALGLLSPQGRLSNPRGMLVISSNIPFGAGLGSSAALSVALTRWLKHLFPQEFPSRDPVALIDFARRLEDHFHGKSSGMDVAVVSLEKPILFSMERGPRPLELLRLPRFLFHDTGVRVSTRDCVAKVRNYLEKNPESGRQLDRDMNRATELAMQGLALFQEDERGGLENLRASMEVSSGVFAEWGLIPSEVIPQIESLKSENLACRLTGAGGGGFLISLTAGAPVPA